MEKDISIIEMERKLGPIIKEISLLLMKVYLMGKEDMLNRIEKGVRKPKFI